MQIDPAVTSYIESQQRHRRLQLASLHALILELYPDVVADMHYKMPTYRHGEGWVALANRKHHVSLYTCDTRHLEAFRKACPDIPTGKGCINFRDRDTLDIEAVTNVIRHAFDHPKLE